VEICGDSIAKVVIAYRAQRATTEEQVKMFERKMSLFEGIKDEVTKASAIVNGMRQDQWVLVAKQGHGVGAESPRYKPERGIKLSQYRLLSGSCQDRRRVNILNAIRYSKFKDPSTIV
jgi:hypothetical protein